MAKRFFCGVVVCLAMSACVNLTPNVGTPEEQAYMSAVMATPLTVLVAKDDTEDAWGRAQSWLGKYSSMKIQVVSDYVIETYNPTGSSVDFGYNVTKTPMGDACEIAVRCGSSNMFAGEAAETNAHILAYYIKTGICNPKFIVQ